MLYLVTGPPASGKSTWVTDHAQPGDIVIDYDHIAQALGSPHHHEHPAHIKTLTMAARQAAIDAALPLTDTHDVYLIHSAPTDKQRAKYETYRARFITIDPGRDTVLARIDDDRPWQLRRVAEDWYTPKAEAEMPKPSRPAPSPLTRRRTRPQTTTEKGYGGKHQKMRERYEASVRAGGVICWRCNNPIAADGPWDLGHDDNDRTQYRGPEHVGCNRGAPHRKEAGADTSRDW